MSLVSLVIILALVGLITWAVTTYIPMPPAMKRIILIQTHAKWEPVAVALDLVHAAWCSLSPTSEGCAR